MDDVKTMVAVKTIALLFIALVIALVIAPACNVLQENNADDVVITLGEPFRLYVGETGRMGNVLQVTFESLVEDSRCPLDTTCIWEGEIAAAFRVTTNSESRAVPFKGFLGQDSDDVLQAWVGQYNIAIEQIRPYPRLNASIDEDKSATLVVRQQGT